MATPALESPRLSVEQIYARYHEQVGRWAQRLWGRGTDVEDIVQDVFLTVWREEARALALDRRDDNGDPLERWLYKVTENAVYNHRWRERWRRRLASASDTTRTDTELPSEAPNAFDLVHRAEIKGNVYDILDRLGDRYRTVLILFELEGLSGEEIASLTRTKLATVWVRLHRARAKFLRELARRTPAPTTETGDASRQWNDA